MKVRNTQQDHQKAEPQEALTMDGGTSLDVLDGGTHTAESGYAKLDVRDTDRQRAFVLSRVYLSFCILAGFAYLPLAMRLLPVLTGRQLVFHGIFSLILVLLGISFLFYYPFKRFGPLSTMVSIAFIYGGLILAFWFKTDSQKELVLLFHGFFCVFLTLWKLGFPDMTFPARLPFNVCNILVLFIIFRPLLHKVLPPQFYTMLDNYILCFGITAALVNYLIGAFFDGAFPNGSYGMGVFFHRLAEGVLLHIVFFSYCVYALVTETIKVNVASSMTNMIWIIPWFIIFSFINQIWKTDYFFTGTHGVTPAFLIKLYYFWPGRFTIKMGKRNFDVNILHSLFVIGAAALVLFAMSFGLHLFQKSFPAFFSNLITELS